MKAVVVCPGRGTYNKTELGYLGAHFPDAALLARFDKHRRGAGQPAISELDGTERFSVAGHTRGDNASALIFAATLGDFLSIDRDAVDVVAVTGNSMGWYSALACAGAMSHDDGFHIANRMGTLMQQALIGGQLIYPFVDEDWRPRPERRAELLALVDRIAAAGHGSRELGRRALDASFAVIFEKPLRQFSLAKAARRLVHANEGESNKFPCEKVPRGMRQARTKP